MRVVGLRCKKVEKHCFRLKPNKLCLCVWCATPRRRRLIAQRNVSLRFSGTHCLASWEAVLLWSLSSSFWWFATGHQASISSIPWNAAFVGFRGNHPTVALPALMVTLNLFASQVLHTCKCWKRLSFCGFFICFYCDVNRFQSFSEMFSNVFLFFSFFATNTRSWPKTRS